MGTAVSRSIPPQPLISVVAVNPVVPQILRPPLHSVSDIGRCSCCTSSAATPATSYDTVDVGYALTSTVAC
jgi:hypothetical protein